MLCKPGNGGLHGMRSRGTRFTAPAARKVYGYVRVSTEDQAREGVSLAAQEARLRAYCEATGRMLDAIITDAGLSAKNTDRPGLQRIIQAVRAGDVGTVLVLKIDRATRNVRDLADLIDLFATHDCAFVSVTESIDTGSAAGRMITNLLGVLAQFEREQVGERTAFALAHKRKQKQAYGHAPFGWQREGNGLVAIASEQRALLIIRDMDSRGVSYRRIGAWLEENGFAAHQSGKKQWHAASVRKLLLSKMFVESCAEVAEV